MNELDPTVSVTLDRWSCHESIADWSDVLRRAGSDGRRDRSRRTARRLALPLVAVLALLAAPAFGVGGGLHDLIAGKPSRRGLQLTAALTGPADATGHFAIDAPNAWIARLGKRSTVRPLFHSGGSRLLLTTPLSWKLTFAGLDSPARDARIRRGPGRKHGAVLALLCAPCESGASGRIHPTRDAINVLFNGRAFVEVRSATGALRGMIRLELPRRRTR